MVSSTASNVEPSIHSTAPTQASSWDFPWTAGRQGSGEPAAFLQRHPKQYCGLTDDRRDALPLTPWPNAKLPPTLPPNFLGLGGNGRDQPRRPQEKGQRNQPQRHEPSLAGMAATDNGPGGYKPAATTLRTAAPPLPVTTRPAAQTRTATPAPQATRTTTNTPPPTPPRPSTNYAAPRSTTTYRPASTSTSSSSSRAASSSSSSSSSSKK